MIIDNDTKLIISDCGLSIIKGEKSVFLNKDINISLSRWDPVLVQALNEVDIDIDYFIEKLKQLDHFDMVNKVFSYKKA